MSLLIRKLVCLFFLTNLIVGGLMAQTVPFPIGPIVGGLMNIDQKQKPIKVFKHYKLETGDAIIGIGFSDSANGRYDKFSFIIDNANDLNELKESWKFIGSEPVTDQRTFNIYFTKNKVIRNGWIVYPESKAIVTDKGFFAFDTSLLSTLHAKHPLMFSVRTDTVSNKNDFLRVQDSVKADPSFLFLMQPDLSYEGSFEITIKAGSKISAGSIGEKIIKRCDKVKPGSAFKVYLKDDGKTYIVTCSQFLFEQFSDPDMEKGSWTPAVYTFKSYWRMK